MREKIASVIESDYAGVLKRKMEGVYAVPIGSGQDRGLEKEKRERDQRQAFKVSPPAAAVWWLYD